MRVNRLGLVPVSSLDPAVRRYRLARLEEVALETPPNGSANGARQGTVEGFARPGQANPSTNGIRDRRVG
jgi:hypothetical protein